LKNLDWILEKRELLCVNQKINQSENFYSGLSSRATARTKRLGKSPFIDDGLPQPLRVILPTATVVRDILSSAKYLCQSADEYVRSNVYINADLTRADAEAAYHARCARRQARQRKYTMSFCFW